MGPLVDIKDSEVEAVTQVTGVHVAYMSKAMASQLLKRKEKLGQKAALIITGSGLGHRPVSGTITYSAAKSFA